MFDGILRLLANHLEMPDWWLLGADLDPLTASKTFNFE